MWVWAYSRVWGPFAYPAWWIQLFSGCWTLVDGCLAVDFSGLKVGQIHLYSSFVNISGIDCKSLDSTEYDYIPELGGWLELGFHLAFMLTQLGFIEQLICRMNCRSGLFCFVSHNFVCGQTIEFEKYFNFKQLEHFISWPRGACRHIGTSSLLLTANRNDFAHLCLVISFFFFETCFRFGKLTRANLLSVKKFGWTNANFIDIFISKQLASRCRTTEQRDTENALSMA